MSRSWSHTGSRHIGADRCEGSPIMLPGGTVRDALTPLASADHRNAASSACDGDLKPRVCRGRSLSSAATASRSS